MGVKNQWIEVTLRLYDQEASVAEAAVEVVSQHCGGVAENVDQKSIPIVQGYLPSGENGQHLLKQIKSDLIRLEVINSLPVGSLSEEVNTNPFQETDWANNWKKFYKPVRAGRHFIVSPPWEKPLGLAPENHLIVLDPGQAFGTGHHESTRLCLTLLEELPLENWQIADVGCGSGILSIGAAKLGAGKIWACDPDPIAMKATRRNAGINQVKSQITSKLGSVEILAPNGPFDLICANILADVLASISEDLSMAAKTGGYLIWSGIMSHQLPRMEAVCNRWFLRVEKTIRENEWIALLLQKVR